MMWLNLRSENERTLLREMHTHTRLIIIEERRDLLHDVYGEIYGHVEYG